MTNSNLYLFRQLLDETSHTYTYLLGDLESRSALLIDPVLEQRERDLQLLKELGLSLQYVLETHVHADHVTSSGFLRQQTQCQVGVGAPAAVSCADLQLKDGQTLALGALRLQVIATPGHTSGCTSYYCEQMKAVFSGDALLIRGCGRTDFQEGDSQQLFGSITKRLFTLPDDTLVYPGHEYKGRSNSSIAEEKAHNPRAGGGKSLAEFQKIMAELKLSPPAKIQEAVPLNLRCGLPE